MESTSGLNMHAQVHINHTHANIHMHICLAHMEIHTHGYHTYKHRKSKESVYSESGALSLDSRTLLDQVSPSQFFKDAEDLLVVWPPSHR